MSYWLKFYLTYIGLMFFIMFGGALVYTKLYPEPKSKLSSYVELCSYNSKTETPCYE